MDPRKHNPIFWRKHFIWIELSGPQIIQVTNPRHLYLHNLFVLLLWKRKIYLWQKLETLAERKFKIRGLKNKSVLELGTWSTLWMYFLKGWQLMPIFLLFDGESIHPKTPDLQLKLNYLTCAKVKGKFQSGTIVYTVILLS